MKPPILVFNRSQELAAAVARQLPHVGEPGFGACEAVGIVSADGRPLGAVVYHDYIPSAGTCQISMASMSPLWAHPQTVADLLAIPFDQYRVRKIWTCIPHDNERAIRFNEGIGMKREATLRHQFAQNRHAVIFGMMRGQYLARWRARPAMKEAA